jgi:hypothetical protein
MADFLTVTYDDTRAQLRLSGMTDGVRRSLLRGFTRNAIVLTRRMRDKLAGWVLFERTHHLHDSVHYEVTAETTEINAEVGTDVGYGRFWEYGFHGVEQIREHLRRMTVAFGRPVETPRDVLVRAHARHVDEAPRSFARSSFSELWPEMHDDLVASAKGGL